MLVQEANHSRVWFDLRRGRQRLFPCATMPVSSAIKRGRGFSGRAVFMPTKASLARSATWSIRDREQRDRAQLANLTVADTCNTCHKEQVRAENKFSHHPMREGKMNCASCHNPHGTTSPKLVKAISTRELCFNCHAQYRGPFIFQHPPVMEDCFNCHQPHGSAYPALLKTPPIRLCRDCHITFHNTNFTIGGPGADRQG